LADKVYNLNVSDPKNNTNRAFERGLIDFQVEGQNKRLTSDHWATLLGMSEELFYSYQGYNITAPLEWLLFRFLAHHVRTNSVSLINGMGGAVLTTTTFKNYLGNIGDIEQAKESLIVVLSSWVATFPNEPIEFGDLFISTDISLDILERTLNNYIFNKYIEEINNSKVYQIKPILFTQNKIMNNPVSLDRISNRYYQQIVIQAHEPYCFIIMPFKEEEFNQTIYSKVIKPFIENEFKISCYRVDEDGLPDRIDNKIYSYILRASFIIAEVTTRNPNVMYELGLAHMLEKDCIILTQSPNSQVPFDIQRISAVPYETDDQLKAYLQKTISALAFKLNK
jgi:hypothetical protein